MANWNEIKSTVGTAAGKTLRAAGELADIAKLNIKVKALSVKLSGKFEKLGRLTYKQLKTETSYAEDIAVVIADIDQLRADFPGGWPGDTMDFFTEEGRKAAKVHTDGKPVEDGLIADLYDYSSRLFQWRKTKDVIHNGKTLHFMRRDNTYAYFRYDDNDVVFVYVNNSNEPKNIPWTYYKEISAGLKGGVDVVTGQSVEISDATVADPQSVMIVEFEK